MTCHLLTILLLLSLRLISVLVQYCVHLVPATFVCSCVHFCFFGRPLVEYNSIIWSSATIRDIDSLESVQRRFSKRLSGLKNLNYYDRLERLNVPTLELHRLRADYRQHCAQRKSAGI